MAFAKISQTACYVPEQIVTNDDLSKIIDTSDEWISSRTGIKERRISRNQDTSDLASQVAQQLLDKSGYQPEDIDFIIFSCLNNCSEYIKALPFKKHYPIIENVIDLGMPKSYYAVIFKLKELLNLKEASVT